MVLVIQKRCRRAALFTAEKWHRAALLDPVAVSNRLTVWYSQALSSHLGSQHTRCAVKYYQEYSLLADGDLCLDNYSGPFTMVAVLTGVDS